MSAPTKERSDAREVLLAAADLVERGWIQHETRAPGRWPWSPIRRCAIGAICDAAPGAVWAACDALDVARAYVGTDLGRWNDAPERTQDEVVATLRAAAGRL